MSHVELVQSALRVESRCGYETDKEEKGTKIDTYLFNTKPYYHIPIYFISFLK